MKLARSIGLCFFVIAALVQMPTGASAAQNIILPSGSWDVTVTVTLKDAGNRLAFGMQSPQSFQICGDPPTEGGCAGGETNTSSGLSGELVFYLTDQTCHQTFQSTDAQSALITEINPTSWTIGWDDGGGPCGSRDHDFNDLIASVVASQPTTANSASGFYDGVNTLDISTPFGTKDSMRSEIIVPGPADPNGYQAGPVTDTETSAKTTYITFCGGGMCDAQVDVSTLPGGSQANTASDPGLPIKVILYFKDDAVQGDAVYAQGDASGATPRLLAKCDSPTVATVNGGDPTKCVASITTSSGKDKIKKVVVLVPSGNDPIIGKR